MLGERAVCSGRGAVYSMYIMTIIVSSFSCGA